MTLPSFDEADHAVSFDMRSGCHVTYIVLNAGLSNTEDRKNRNVYDYNFTILPLPPRDHPRELNKLGTIKLWNEYLK